MGDEPRVVTIDGTAASGKSTVASRVASTLSFALLQSGLLYRAVARMVLDEGLSPDDESAIMEMLSGRSLEILPHASGNVVLVDDEDITTRLQSPDVDVVVSRVARHVLVRDHLLPLQRKIPLVHGSLVAEGRDMGTVVFPDADYKFFITASVEERARRRFEQLRGEGIEVDMGSILDGIRERDSTDSLRNAAPLRAPEDSIVIDTTYKTLEDVVNLIVSRVAGRNTR